MNPHDLGSRKTLVSLIGIDYSLLLKSSEYNISKFVLAGMFVVFILILSFVSVYYAFDLMFNIWEVQILLSLFFSMMFATIYVLLLQTFSKRAFGGEGKHSKLNLSNITRGLFIVFIGFLLSKPIEILYLRNELNDEIDYYKKTISLQLERQTEGIYKTDIIKLKTKIASFKGVLSELQKEDLSKLNFSLEELLNKIEVLKTNANNKIKNSDYFTKRVIIASTKYPSSWLICGVIILCFSLPVGLIYTISSDDEYYALKRHHDEALVKYHYEIFIKKYSETFKKKFNIENIQFYEPWQDPPFRTKRIEKKIALQQNDFFKPFL